MTEPIRSSSSYHLLFLGSSLRKLNPRVAEDSHCFAPSKFKHLRASLFVMGKKKSKDPNSVAGCEAAVSSQPDVFKTIFGDAPELDAAASSLFSDSNPFKRKPQDSVAPVESIVSVRTQRATDSSGPRGSQLKQGKRKKENENAEKPSRASVGEDLEDGDMVPEKKPKVVTDHHQVSEGSVESNALVNQNEFERRRKKRKRDEVEREYEARKYGVTSEEEEAKKVGGKGVGQKRKKADEEEAEALVPKEGFDDENKLMRTVFVGNLPLKVKKKVLLKEFSQFGDIESVRIRSVPLADTKKPRKGAIMLKQINENVDSVHAYIVFKTEESATASLALNMAVVAGNHIRVDRACPPRKKLKGDLLYDNKRTVFVGNLPFDVKDEELYQLFGSISNLESSVEAIRVVRDPHIGLGKGIAYVLFRTKEAANIVVKKKGLKLRDRELRLSHARADATPSKRNNPSTALGKESPAKKFMAVSKSPRSDDKTMRRASMSYQGLRASKSGGVQKKVGSSASKPRKTTPGAYKGEGPTERKSKRPAVAARRAKANAVKDAGGTPRKQGGIKRKMDSQTPQSVHNKKAKRLR